MKFNMRNKIPKLTVHAISIISISLAIQLLLTAGIEPNFVLAKPQVITPNTRRVNVPELTDVPFAPAIFWFGKVDSINNYADVRTW